MWIIYRQTGVFEVSSNYAKNTIMGGDEIGNLEI